MRNEQSPPRSPLSYLLSSIAAQVIAFGLTLLLVRNVAAMNSAVLAPAFQALVALAVARLMRLPLAWQIVNLAVFPSLLLLQTLQLPAWIFPAFFLGMLIIYIPTFWTRVPFYPSSPQMYQEVAKLLPNDKPFRFVDLGSGYGSMLSYLAKQFPHGQFEGYEIAPLPALVSWLRSLPFGSRLRLRFQSFWPANLSKYDYVYAFLAPDPMPKLWEKAKSEMRPSSLFLVNSFKVEAKSEREIAVADKRNCILYLYRI